MSELLIPDLSPAVVSVLRQRALEHGRSLEDEAKTILEQAVHAPPGAVWSDVDAIRAQLESSGRVFHDSAPLVREDRDR